MNSVGAGSFCKLLTPSEGSSIMGGRSLGAGGISTGVEAQLNGDKIKPEAMLEASMTEATVRFIKYIVLLPLSKKTKE